MFGPHLFDAYIRDGITGETRPIPRSKVAPLAAIYVGDGAEYESASTPFCDYPDPVFLELTHRVDRGGALPDGIEGRVLDRKDNMVRVWFQRRGVYVVHANAARPQEEWGAAA